MPQFFIHSNDINDNRCLITGDDFHHLARVRRVSAGSTVKLRDERGRLIFARVTGIDERSLSAEIVRIEEGAATGPEFVLYASLIKGQRFDYLIQKCVEIGVTAIVPVFTERSVPRPDGKGEKKETRWNAIAREAAKQSQRSLVPPVLAAVDFEAAIAQNRGSLRVIAHPAAEQGMREFFRGLPPWNRVCLFVGPEGGFSARELEQAAAAGWITLACGTNQLRAETAAIALSAVILYEWSAFDESDREQ